MEKSNKIDWDGIDVRFRDIEPTPEQATKLHILEWIVYGIKNNIDVI